MRPSSADLQNLWIFAYSRASLLEADYWLNAMSNTAAGTPQFESLICATVVSYARPFTKSQITAKKRIIPLKDVPPPPTLHNTHSMLLKLRDKVMGHKDATPASGDTRSPNILVLDRDDDGFNLHTIRIGGMEACTRTETRALCDHFVQFCEAQLRPLIERYGPEIMKQSIGRYELLVNEPPHPWIRPLGDRS